MLAFTGSSRWLLAALATVIVLTLRMSWHAAATIALADTVMTRVLVEAGAMPLGPATAGAGERASAPAPGTRPVAVQGLNQPSTPHAA
jgi:hypothetical protein